MAFTVYKPYSDNPIGAIAPQDMYRNQKILSGADPQFLTDDGTFFLDTLVLASGETVTITDGKDTTVVTNMLSFESAFNHIRCDYGIKITGNVVMAKGYVIEHVVKP